MEKNYLTEEERLKIERKLGVVVVDSTENKIKTLEMLGEYSDRLIRVAYQKSERGMIKRIYRK